MQGFYDILERLTELDPRVVRSLIATLLILAFAWVSSYVTKLIVKRHFSDDRQRFLWSKNIRYIIGFVSFFLIGRLWLEGFQSLATYLGLLSAGLAIALKDVVADFAAWLFLLWRRPFNIGDRIEIGNHRGDVIDKRVFKFSMVEIGNWVDADQSTGRVIHIPNHRVFLDSIANYTTGFSFIWNELVINLTFDSNWKKAKEILIGIAQKHSSEITPEAEKQIRESALEYMIVFKYLTPNVYTSVGPNGIKLTVRYLTHPRSRRGSEQVIWEDILTAFAEHPDIKYTYQTIRYVGLNDDKGESKPDFLNQAD
jgi:small-conductance mechanosensitive channel